MLPFEINSEQETREDLKKKFEELINKAKEIKPEEVKETIENKIDEIKAELEDLDKEKVLAIAKEKATQIKEKCEDLENRKKALLNIINKMHEKKYYYSLYDAIVRTNELADYKYSITLDEKYLLSNDNIKCTIDMDLLERNGFL